VILALVAALDRNGAIGRGNALPWHLPDDLKRFKALTLGHPVLMGRRTAESIGGQEALTSLDALRASVGAQDTVFVIGGGEIYALALPQAARLYLTHVDTVVDDADAFFPHFDACDWQVASRAAHPADALHAHAFEFVDYVRASR
jgi:dihydrofolate reductase